MILMSEPPYVRRPQHLHFQTAKSLGARFPPSAQELNRGKSTSNPTTLVISLHACCNNQPLVLCTDSDLAGLSS